MLVSRTWTPTKIRAEREPHAWFAGITAFVDNRSAEPVSKCTYET